MVPFIIFVKLGTVDKLFSPPLVAFSANILPPPLSLNIGGLHTMVFDYSTLKICAEELFAHATFYNLAISLTIAQHKS